MILARLTDPRDVAARAGSVSRSHAQLRPESTGDDTFVRLARWEGLQRALHGGSCAIAASCAPEGVMEFRTDESTEEVV